MIFDFQTTFASGWTNVAAIAKKVDDLGNQFRPAMLTGWLAYIAKTYQIQDVSTGPALGQDSLIMPDEDM